MYTAESTLARRQESAERFSQDNIPSQGFLPKTHQDTQHHENKHEGHAHPGRSHAKKPEMVDAR